MITNKVSQQIWKDRYQKNNETFDENLKYSHQNLSFIKGKRDKIYFKDKRNVIMEVKAHGVIPLWLAGIMSAEKIYPQQFSKIGKVYEKLRKENNV